MAGGVERVGRRARDRFITSAYMRATQQHSHVSSICGASHREPAAPGMRASLDLTRRFSPDLDGYTCAALFLDENTHKPVGPMKDHHTGTEFGPVFSDYRRFVRTFFRTELLVVRSDCDPTFAVNHHGAIHNSA